MYKLELLVDTADTLFLSFPPGLIRRGSVHNEITHPRGKEGNRGNGKESKPRKTMNLLKLFMGLFIFSTTSSLADGKRMGKRKHRKKGVMPAESGHMPTVIPKLVFGTGLYMTGLS